MCPTVLPPSQQSYMSVSPAVFGLGFNVKHLSHQILHQTQKIFNCNAALVRSRESLRPGAQHGRRLPSLDFRRWAGDVQAARREHKESVNIKLQPEAELMLSAAEAAFGFWLTAWCWAWFYL